VLSRDPHRMFAHQLGDGFVIVGEFGWPSLEQPLTVAVALLRAVLASHGMAKAAISEGRFADVVGCYPLRIQEIYAKSYGGAIPMGGGVMTILPVMGTALINSYKLLHSEATPSGALLLVQAAAADRVPPGRAQKSTRDSSSSIGSTRRILGWSRLFTTQASLHHLHRSCSTHFAGTC